LVVVAVQVDYKVPCRVCRRLAWNDAGVVVWVEYRLCLVAGAVHTKSRDTATLLGLVKRQSAFTPVEDLKARSDFESVFCRVSKLCCLL